MLAEARPLPTPSRLWRAPRWAWLALLAALLVVAAGAGFDRWTGAASPLDPASLRPGFGPATYAEAQAEAERNVTEARTLLKLGPDEWLRQEQLALALVGRFYMNGDYEDLAHADRLLDTGVGGAPDPAGPVLSKAMVSLLIHRPDAADAALARFARWGIPYPRERAEAVTMSGDAALQRGELNQAAVAYATARAMGDTSAIEPREAMLAAYRGEREEARGALERMLAAPRQPPATLAQMALQRANLAYAEGDWDGAGPWIAAANRLFPGYWLAEAYAAQQQALAGRTEDAIRAYRALATRSGRPEVMDALAQLLRLEGRRAESLAWWRRADAIWRRRLAQVPEAAALHAVEHELVAGSLTRALEFAREDVARRPAGPGIALLARALILAGRPHEALAWLDRAERQGWVSAGHLMLRADAAAAAGDEAASDAARNRAEAINPKAADPATRLVWFGHD